MNQIDKILASIDKLPPFSPKVEEALRTLRNPDINIQQVVNILQYDPAITANILRFCNSPIFGVTREISSLQQASVLLGLDRLRKIILTASVEKYFPTTPRGYEVRKHEIWRHSLLVAMVAEELAGRFDGISPDVAFTAGLLHDIGKIITTHFLASEFSRVEEAVEEGKTFLEVERTIIGIDHMEAGARVLKKWAFASDIQDVAAHHHAPPEDQPFGLVHLVHIADVAAILMGWNTGVDALHYPGDTETFRTAGIGMKSLQEMVCRLSDKVLNLEKEYFPGGRNGH